MEIVRIIGVGFVASTAAILLKSSKPELSFAVTVSGVIVILIMIVDTLKDTLGIFSTVSASTGLQKGLIKILLKIVGVGYLTEFGAGILNDFGSSAIAEKVVLGGKITILLLSLPILKEVLTLVVGFLELV